MNMQIGKIVVPTDNIYIKEIDKLKLYISSHINACHVFLISFPGDNFLYEVHTAIFKDSIIYKILIESLERLLI